MALVLSKRCPDEKDIRGFYVIRLRADGRLLLCCEGCESRWGHPGMNPHLDRVAEYPYEPLPADQWVYASWEDLDQVGWERKFFTLRPGHGVTGSSVPSRAK